MESVVAYPKGIERFLIKLKFSRDCLRTPAETLRLYGDVFTIDEQNFYVGNPDLIEKIMQDYETFGKDAADGYSDTADLFWGSAMQVSNGEAWHEKRKLLQSALEPGRVMAYGGIMVNYTLRKLLEWQDGAALDLHKWMGRLMLEITIRNILGVDLPAETVDVVEVALQATLELFGDLGEVTAEMSDPSRQRFDASLRALDAVIYTLIGERRASGEDCGDLLSALLRTELSDRALRDEITTFLRAGHRNSAALLTWCFAELARNPAVTKQLTAELDQVLGKNPPNVQHLARLTFTEQVITEAMRLYPLYPFIVRTAKKAVVLGNDTLPAGAKLGIDVWGLHRHDAYYQSPNKFDPSRWKNEQKPPRYTFLPFGGGARPCPFKSYGQMEAVLVLATIAQRYTFQLAPGEKAKVHYTKNGLLPKNGLQVIVRQRTV